MAPSLYDISPLVPLVEQGCMLLTPNDRLARRIKSEWDAMHVAAGRQTWEPLPIQPLESWLMGQWELAVRRRILPSRTPLSPAQALELWRQVIRQHETKSSEYLLLRPAAAAELAARARSPAPLAGRYAGLRRAAIL
ncbi:MAG: hypothetical protein R3E50_10715 [Halioglobus sp.]